MEKKEQKKLSLQLKIFSPVTQHCKICFEEIKSISFYSFVNPKNILCEKCFSEFKARFINFSIGDVHALAIYNYNETIKKLIYTFKGCYDYELKDVFLTRYLLYLKIIYHGYTVVPAPSSQIDDSKRGFNHVVEIFKSLGLPMAMVLKKVSRDKQSSKSRKKRLKINSEIILENPEQIKGKKVLIVDDVYTTGATLYKSISLIKEAKPKCVKALVIAKTIDIDKRNRKQIFAKLY